MADKPILEIDIDNTAFKEFQAKFDAYKEACKQLPAAWSEAGNRVEGLSASFEAMVAKMAQANAAVSAIADKTGEAGSDQSMAADAWTRISYNSKHFAGHIAKSTASLAKWTGLTTLFGSILSAGGLYGISRMASGVGAILANATKMITMNGFMTIQNSIQRLSV